MKLLLNITDYFQIFCTSWSSANSKEIVHRENNTFYVDENITFDEYGNPVYLVREE